MNWMSKFHYLARLRIIPCWMLVFVFLITGCNLQTPATIPTEARPTTTPGESRLVVAWVDAGNLIVWQTGDSIPRRVASGGVIQPFIAPDGNHIAFTRGPNGAPETLWSVDVAGTAEQQLVGERPRNYTPGVNQIGDVTWLDEAILYFNTLTQSSPSLLPNNDLYRANIRTREVALILPATEGGRFAISPDKQKIAVVYPGNYGRQDGRIVVLDPLALREPRNLLFFVGVATGSERSFYPQLHWLPDSSAVLTAIPDSDLVYHDTGERPELPFTRIWHLPVDNPSDRELMGSLMVSFYGMPRWSDDGSKMTFLRRAALTNDFTVYLADRGGGAEQALFAGTANTLEQPEWITGTQDFYYARAEPDGTFLYYLDGVGRDIAPLSDETDVLLPQFVNPDIYVFVSPAQNGLEMRVATLGQPSQLIGDAGQTIPVFDAILTEG